MIQRDGRWYQADRTNLFSGLLVDYNREGYRVSRSAMSNGIPNGISQTWYTNGQLSMVEHFKDGVSHGPREKWYENGQKMAEASIVEGKIEGTFRRWFDNGELAEQIEMKHGQPDGTGLGYFPSGFLQWRVHLKDGKELDRQTWKDGELKTPPVESQSKAN